VKEDCGLTGMVKYSKELENKKANIIFIPGLFQK
jgi:hypothetical protein